MKKTSDLIKLADLFGIQTSFENMEGKRVTAPARTIKAILETFDVPAGTAREARESLRLEAHRRWSSLLDPVTAFWDRQPGWIKVRLPEDLTRTPRQEIRFEDGTCKTTDLVPGRYEITAKAKIGGRVFVERKVPVPGLAFGYHEFEIRVGSRRTVALLISAPGKSYSPPSDEKRWGVFAPLYSLHSKTSWGAGNFEDLRRLNEWVSKAGGSIVATLPATAAFLGAPVCEPSPYSPASRLFWNEFFLDIPALPEFSRCRAAQRIVRSADFQKELAHLRSSGHVDYRAGMRLRRKVLEELAKTLFTTDSARRKAFERFAREHKRLTDYAEFRAVCDKAGRSWRTWESRLYHGKIQPEDYAPGARQYHAYVQWAAEEQVQRVCTACSRNGNSIYLDLPLGVNSDSYDFWRERDYFAMRASVGAPPDAFFSKGQDWGFAPPHPRRVSQRGYQYIREYLRFQMRHASMLRIDHVMGLHRLYWIPHGLPGTEGAYVKYPAEEYYAVLNLESHRNKTLLVGENLGTVPPEVNAELERRKFRTMFVTAFEQRLDARPALPNPPGRCVASINTHDMPTFAAHATGAELVDRAKLGLIDPRDLEKEQRRRRRLMSQLQDFLKRRNAFPNTEEGVSGLLKACARWLAASPAETVLITLEDLWGELNPQNVPGTSSERPNWKRKMRYSLEDLERMTDLNNFLRSLRRKTPHAKTSRS